MDADPSNTESGMSQSGPRNFFCHQCNSRTRVSIEEFTCSSCGSGFIEEIVESEANEGRDGGANSDEPWAQDADWNEAHEMMGPHSMIEQIFAHALGPGGMQSQGAGGGPTVIRSTRRAGPNSGAARGSGGPSIFIGTSAGGGPGDQFLQSLISNLTGMQGPGQFQFLMGGPPGSGVMYGNPGDYAWGRGGFDAIVTQLLNQMEGAGPPKMEKDDITSLPTIKVTQDHIDQKAQCSVCWEDFNLDESVNQLRCEHIFHKDCITPWLELHATCPVCRKPQNEAAAAHDRQTQNEANSERDSSATVTSSNFFGDSYRDDDSPMFDERPSHDPSPSTSTTTSARRANSTTTSSNPETSGPSTVPAGAEAAYSLGNPISTIFNQIFGGQPSPSSSSRSSRNQFSFGFPSSTPNTNPSQSNAFPQATSSSQEANGESTDSQSPVPPLVDVSSSSSTDMGENCNSTTPNDSGSSLPSADSSTGRSSTRLNARSGNDSSSSATSSRRPPTDFQDFDLE